MVSTNCRAPLGWVYSGSVQHATMAKATWPLKSNTGMARLVSVPWGIKWLMLAATPSLSSRLYQTWRV